MLFRVGRTFAVVVCVGVVAIDFAAAADIPYVQSPAPAYVPPTPSWAGFYLGGQVGYGMDSVRWRNLGGSAFFSPPNSLTRDRGSGVIGGGQLGYNFQYNRLVFGIEGSISAADFDRSFASPYFPATDVWSSRLTWLTTVTGRVGYGFDSWLPYIKGGFAAGNVETSIQTNPFGVSSQGSAVHSGWTLGGGVAPIFARPGIHAHRSRQKHRHQRTADRSGGAGELWRWAAKQQHHGSVQLPLRSMTRWRQT
jgi:outer membrane immunogenic protein